MLRIRCGLRELAVNLRRDPFNLGLAVTCYHGLSLRDSVVLRGELWTAEPNSASSSLKASLAYRRRKSSSSGGARDQPSGGGGRREPIGSQRPLTSTT